MGLLLLLLPLLFIDCLLPTPSVGKSAGLQSENTTEPESGMHVVGRTYPESAELDPVQSGEQDALSDMMIAPTDLSLVGEHGNRVLEGPEVEVSCARNQMTLSVSKKWNDVDLKAESLTFGNGCKSNGESSHRLLFIYYFFQCGTKLSMNNGNEIYSNVLYYALDADNPAHLQGGAMAIPVNCTLERSQDYMDPFMTFPPPTMEAAFHLKTMDQTNVYRRRQPIHFQAIVEDTAEDQQLYILSCHATSSPDPEARPQLRVIVKNGCVAYVASKRGQARFVPSGRRDAVNFIINAFSFSSPEVYFHCDLAVHEGGQLQPTNPATTNRNNYGKWEELNGDTSVCECCRTTCHDSTLTDSRVRVSTGPLVILDEELAEAQVPIPLLSDQTISTEAGTPLGEASGSGAPFGHLEFLQQPQAWPPTVVPAVPEHSITAAAQNDGHYLLPDAAQHGSSNFAENYLDGTPVLQQAWGMPIPAPEGWLATGATSPGIPWVFPPVMGHGVIIVRQVHEEPELAMVSSAPGKESSLQHPQYNAIPQVQSKETLLQFPQDDPSAVEDQVKVLKGAEQQGIGNVDSTIKQDVIMMGLEQFSLPPAEGSKDDMFNSVLEEAKRKQWGGKLGTYLPLTQEGSIAWRQGKWYPVQNDQQPKPADQGPNPRSEAELNGGTLEDEGLVLKKTTLLLHKAKGQLDPAVLSARRSQLQLTLSSEPSLRYEEEDAGLGRGSDDEEEGPA